MEGRAAAPPRAVDKLKIKGKWKTNEKNVYNYSENPNLSLLEIEESKKSG